MELNKKERLFLYNQYRILEKLYPDESDDYQKAQDILLNGFSREYSTFIEWILDDTPIEICNEVIDILQMYRSLYFSYLELDDKSDINEDTVMFQGFDGNEESDHYMYADFVIEKNNRFSEFKNVGINSHHNTLYKYRPMLDRWRKYERYSTLTKSQIIDVLGK